MAKRRERGLTTQGRLTTPTHNHSQWGTPTANIRNSKARKQCIYRRAGRRTTMPMRWRAARASCASARYVAYWTELRAFCLLALPYPHPFHPYSTFCCVMYMMRNLPQHRSWSPARRQITPVQMDARSICRSTALHFVVGDTQG